MTTTLGINQLLKRFPRELSNGQRQRVALGRVLVRPADVYLLDEPLSHLDAKLRAAMRAELKQLGAMSNTTTIYVTHDYQEALALGDRIAVMRDGKLVQIGTPEEIWRRPADTFVARVARSAGDQRPRRRGRRRPDPARRTARSTCAIPRGRRRRPRRPRPSRAAALRHSRHQRRGLRCAARCLLAERLGRNIELTVDVGGAQLIVLTSGRHGVGEGDDVTMTIADSDVHVFAAGEGDTRRLDRRPRFDSGGSTVSDDREAPKAATARRRA